MLPACTLIFLPSRSCPSNQGLIRDVCRPRRGWPMLTRRSLIAAGLAAASVGAGAAEGAHLRIGYQKNGILVVAKEQGAIEARLRPLGVTVSWVEFSFGPPLLEA